jgi:mannose-6-phosphate isomerase
VSSPAEILYANARYQVRIRSLAPQAETVVPDAQASGEGFLAWALDGEMTYKSASSEPTQISKGQSFGKGEGTPEGNLKNNSPKEVLWLEVIYGQFETIAPQGETEQRPWGQYTVLRDDARFKLKQLAVKAGNRLSLQRHQKREEHWMIVAGRPDITLNSDILRPIPGEAVLIPLMAWHRITNPTKVNNVPADLVEIIEIQLGEYFGEDDIERSEDDYGRAS